MNDQELREMVRESIARHLGPEQAAAVRLPQTVRLQPDTTDQIMHERSHASHQRLPLVSGDEEGACIIEPSVRCNHCGYCLSLGH
jgi:hypothetical protein